MSNWKPLFGRVTFLTNAPPGPRTASALDLYQQAWQSAPQNFQNPPNPLSPSTAQGTTETMASSCSILPNRIDFSLAPQGPNSGPPGEIPLIENAAVLRAELERISTAFGAGTINVPNLFDRVAVFVQFASIQPTITKANATIAAALPEPYRVRLADEEAFALQLSYPRNIPQTSDSKANLLTKWSVEVFQIVTLSVPTGAPLQNSPPVGLVQPLVRNFLAACVSFDHNTLQTTRTLTRNQQTAALLDGLSAIEDAQANYRLNVEGSASPRWARAENGTGIELGLSTISKQVA